MRGTWKLKLRMILTSVIMFTIIYFLIMIVGHYLGVSSWRLYLGASLVITFLQYWFGPSMVKRSMNGHCQRLKPLTSTRWFRNWLMRQESRSLK